MAISRLLVNEFEWNKVHFLADKIAFKINTKKMNGFYWHNLYIYTLSLLQEFMHNVLISSNQIRICIFLILELLNTQVFWYKLYIRIPEC